MTTNNDMNESFNDEFERFQSAVNILAEADQWILTAIKTDENGVPYYMQQASNDLAAGSLLMIAKQILTNHIRSSFDSDDVEE